MTEPDAEAERLMDAAAGYLGLPVEEAYRAGIRSHLVIARAMAELVLSVELEDEAEPAPVYTP